MKRSLQLIVALIALSMLAGACSPIKEAGAWKLKDMNAAVVFYYVKPGKIPNEAKLKEQVAEIAQTWRKNWNDVQVVVFFDKQFAESLARPQQKETYVTADGIDIHREILNRSSLNPPGGAYLRLSDKLPQLEWAFIGREIARSK